MSIFKPEFENLYCNQPLQGNTSKNVAVTLGYDTMLFAERKYVELLSDMYWTENLEIFKSSSFNNNDCYVYLREVLHMSGSCDKALKGYTDEEILEVLFKNFVYNVLKLAKCNYIKIKSLFADDIVGCQMLGFLSKSESSPFCCVYTPQFRDYYMYQIIRSLYDENPKLVNGLKFFEVTDIKHDISKNLRDNEEYTYNLFKRCIKCGINAIPNKINIQLLGDNAIDYMFNALIVYLGRLMLTANTISPSLYLRYKKLLSNRTVLYYIYQAPRLFFGRKFKGCSFISQGWRTQEIHDTYLGCIDALLSFSAQRTYSLLISNEIEEYNDFVKNMECWVKSLECSSIDSISEDDLNELRALKEEEKRLKTQLWELKRLKAESEKSPITSTISDIIPHEEVVRIEEEIKASRAISIYTKLKVIGNNRILILTTKEINTADLGCNFTIKDANDFKTKSISMNYDYVVLLTSFLSHGIAYDVQSEIKKTDAKLIYSSRINTSLILDDIIDQM